MGLRELAESRGQTVHMFKRSTLNIDPDFNIRDLSTPDNREHVEWLAAEIEAKGFTSNIVIFMHGGKPFVWQGHCRMAAVDLLIERGVWNDDVMVIPALMKPDGVGKLEMFAEQSLNGSSKPLTPREMASNIMRIMALCGQDQDRTAKLIGRSRAYVSQMLQFNEAATPAVHAAVAAGAISQTQAAEILRKEGPTGGEKTIAAAIDRAKAAGKTKATRKHVSPPANGPRKPAPTLPAAMLLPAREAVLMAACVLAREFIDRVSFEFDSADDVQEARRIVSELNLAIGIKPRELAAAE